MKCFTKAIMTLLAVLLVTVGFAGAVAAVPQSENVAAVPHTERQIFRAKLDAEVAERVTEGIRKIVDLWERMCQEMVAKHDQVSFDPEEYLYTKMMYNVLYETHLECVQDAKEKKQIYERMCAENEMYEKQVKKNSEISEISAKI